MTPINPKSAQKRYPKKWHIPVHQHIEVTPPGWSARNALNPKFMGRRVFCWYNVACTFDT